MRNAVFIYSVINFFLTFQMHNIMYNININKRYIKYLFKYVIIILIYIIFIYPVLVSYFMADFLLFKAKRTTLNRYQRNNSRHSQSFLLPIIASVRTSSSMREKFSRTTTGGAKQPRRG